MRLLFLSLIFLTACLPLSESEKLEIETGRAEKREMWAYYEQACAKKSQMRWVCRGPSRREIEREPWLYCGCNMSY